MKERDLVAYSERFFPSEDAAVLKVGATLVSLATDMLVGRTDVPSGMTWRQVGTKSVVQNFSDLAAMGSSPRYFMASMAFPRGFPLAAAKKILFGIRATCKGYGAEFVGGDTNEGELSVAGCAVGFSERVLSRSGAKPGDAVCLTGDVGRVEAGLRNLSGASASMRKKIFNPAARVDVGKTLSANSCIDISDGLSTELHTLSRCSGARMDIESEAIPIHRDVVVAAGVNRKEALELALRSGEEYELLFTCTRRQARQNDFPFSYIGKVSRGKGVFLDGKKISETGWEHFG